jgi:ATP-binding cassette subfamily B multidrug efflux pump
MISLKDYREDTYNVMERGATLSVGQRQLISFVRAMVHEPKIIVLDEATSSVDSETEELIQQAIETLMQGRTAIVIAHRLSTIQEADKIIVVDKGAIVEEGNHEQLLEKEGFYANLYRMQYKEVLKI